jgi:thymidylate synthase (FAD)
VTGQAPEIVSAPRVELIAVTGFRKPDCAEWETDTPVDAEQLIEYAGRMCYQSWSNPAGRTNKEYIANMLEHGHLSVIEHAVATFGIEGVSRSLTHELVRHRHFSFSQVSQRYVSEDQSRMVEPGCIAADPEAHRVFVETAARAQEAYRQIYTILAERFSDVEDRTLRRKLARQAARSVLPNATETKIVMTGNFRAWRHFIRMRANEHADVEIRAVAVDICRQLQEVSPAVFGDYTISKLGDGTEIATAGYVFE